MCFPFFITAHSLLSPSLESDSTECPLPINRSNNKVGDTSDQQTISIATEFLTINKFTLFILSTHRTSKLFPPNTLHKKTTNKLSHLLTHAIVSVLRTATGVHRRELSIQNEAEPSV